jgi:hypothetical protein
LVLYWQEGITVDLLSFSKRHIDVHISGGPYDRMWRCTFVYGEPKAGDHHHMWSLLQHLKPKSSEPWIMLGDFNEAMWQEEHFSLSRRPERLVENFREALSFCDLHEIGFTGRPWTFDNKQKGDRNVRVRLDRAVASPAWSTFFLSFASDTYRRRGQITARCYLRQSRSLAAGRAPSFAAMRSRGSVSLRSLPRWKRYVHGESHAMT